MKELSEELKKTAKEAWEKDEVTLEKRLESACLAVGNAMVEQDRKDAAGPELTDEEYDQIRARSHLRSLCQYKGNGDTSIRREINAVLSRRRSLSESQWAEVEKAIREALNNRWWGLGTIDRFLADVRARLLPPKTPPTPEERVTTVSLGDGITEIFVDGALNLRVLHGPVEPFVKVIIDELRGKREGSHGE